MTRNVSVTQRIQSATPSTPPSGSSILYPKSDGDWYTLDSAGNEKFAFSPFRWIYEDATVHVSTLQTPTTVVDQTTPSLAAGDYLLLAGFSWSYNNAFQDIIIDIIVDGTAFDQISKGNTMRAEAKDPDGAGFEGTGTDTRRPHNIEIPLTLSAGTHTIEIEKSSEGSGVEASMWDILLYLRRVA